MVKRTIKKQVCFCYCCEKEESYLTKCLICGVEHCYDCTKERGYTYGHSIWARGSGDGYYCHHCLSQAKNQNNKMLMQYRKIRSLRVEYESWNKEFEIRREEAEKGLEVMQEDK